MGVGPLLPRRDDSGQGAHEGGLGSGGLVEDLGAHGAVAVVAGSLALDWHDPEQVHQHLMAVLHGVAEGVLPPDDGAGDEDLGPGGDGATSEQSGQPLAAHDLGGLPRLVVGDDPAPLGALGLPAGLLFCGACRALLVRQPAGGVGVLTPEVVDVVQVGGGGVGAHPDRDVDLPVFGLVVLVVGLGLVGLHPLDRDGDGCPGDGGPGFLRDDPAVVGAQVGHGVTVQVGGNLGGVEHGQPFGSQPVDLVLERAGLGALVAQPLDDVRNLAATPGVLPRGRQGVDGVGVVLELSEDRGLFEGHAGGVHPVLGGGVAGDVQRGVDGGAGECHSLGDLSSRDAEHGQLLDGVAGLAGVHGLAVQVLAGLVDDAVGLLGSGHHPHRDGAGGCADLGGDEAAPLAAQDGEASIGVDVGADHLQHAPGLDRRGELLGVGSGIAPHVRADLQCAGVDLVEVAHLVGRGGGVTHGFDSLSNRWN